MCLQNEGYPASLERWKIYRILPDRDAAGHHLIRVMDESGEDYLYPSEFFRPVDLPADLRRLFPAAIASAAVAVCEPRSRPQGLKR